MKKEGIQTRKRKPNKPDSTYEQFLTEQNSAAVMTENDSEAKEKKVSSVVIR